MSVNFDSVSFLWHNGSEWIDIEPDVLANPRPRGRRGISSTDIKSRIADVGTLMLSIKNGDNNSAQTLGYYTPTHTNVISPFWGRPYDYPLKIVFEYEGRYKALRFTFEPGPAGVKVDPFETGQRSVSCRFRDWIGIAQEYKLDLLPSSSSKTADQAMDIIIAAMSANRRPQKTTFRVGDSTFETVFDDTNSGSTVYSESSKVISSELGYLYNRADRTEGELITLDNRNRRYNLAASGSVTNPESSATGDVLLETGDYLLNEDAGNLVLDATTIVATSISLSNANSGNILLETGDVLLLETGDALLHNDTQSANFDAGDIFFAGGFSVNHYDNSYQSARLSVQQKDVGGTAVVLWSMAKPLQIVSGETKTGIRGRYRDPSGGSSYINGSDFQTITAGTDFGAWANSDGTGTDLKANIDITVSTGSAEVEFVTITNNGADAWITNPNLQIRGLPIYPYDSLDIVLGDNVSEKRLDINQHYETDETVGRSYAMEIIKNPLGVTTIQSLPLWANRDTFNINAWMDLDVGSMYNVTESMTNPEYYNPYFINGYEFEMVQVDGNWHVYWTPNGFPYSRVFVPA